MACGSDFSFSTRSFRRAFSCCSESISLRSCLSSTRFCCQTERPCLPLTTCQVRKRASMAASTLPAGRQARAAASAIRTAKEGGFLRPRVDVFSSCQFPSCMCLTRSLLTRHELLGRRPQRLHILFAACLGIGPHHGLSSRKAVAHPRAIFEDQLQPVGAHDLLHFTPAQFGRISLQLLSERGFH